jgi:acetyl esterase/lipase
MNTVATRAAGVPSSEEVPLWPNGAPGSEGMTGQEIVEPPNAEHDYLKVSGIHNPSLVVRLAPKETATGAAVIVAPGGAHRFLAIDIEGYNVADYLTSIGVSAFILKYRLAREEGSPYKVEVHALQDGQRAVRLVRSRAAEWGVNPSRVAIMGFSAGAQLAALAATHGDVGNPGAVDPVDRLSSRPDYQILIYGGGPADGLNITADTPPAFLLGADDDRLATGRLPQLYLAFKRAGVPTELHIYVDGGHGFGIRKPPAPTPCASTWQLRLRDWLDDRGLLRR